MPILEIRRHSLRKTDASSQLSQAGVELARRIGDELGTFQRVVTSVAPRARETAVAMGYAVDQELVTLPPKDFYEELQNYVWADTSCPFADVARLVESKEQYRLYAHRMASNWRDILTPLAGSESALFVGHSGELEAALVACCPGEDFLSWGGVFKPLEGARIYFEGEPAHFQRVEILRVA